MGEYIRLGPWLKLRHTARGWRVGVGPSWARYWFGSGRSGVSTGVGIGPAWIGHYFRLGRKCRR